MSSEAKLAEHLNELKREWEHEPVRTSEASKSLVNFCQATRDPLVPSIWGKVDDRENRYKDKKGCTIL